MSAYKIVVTLGIQNCCENRKKIRKSFLNIRLGTYIFTIVHVYVYNSRLLLGIYSNTRT